jgi:hypothetical protein
MFPSHLTTTRAPEHLTIRTASLRNPHQHVAGRRPRRATGRAAPGRADPTGLAQAPRSAWSRNRSSEDMPPHTP